MTRLTLLEIYDQIEKEAQRRIAERGNENVKSGKIKTKP